MKKNLLKLFLLAAVLMMGAGEMWGDVYYKIHVKAIDPVRGTTPGKVFSCGYNDWNSGAKYAYNDEIWSSDTITGPWTRVYPKNTTKPDIYLCAQEADGAKFVGWYWDEECTNLVSTSKIYNYNDTGVATSDNANTAPVTPFYAKFEYATYNHIYGQLQYIEDEAHRGAIRDYNEEDEPIYYAASPMDFEIETFATSYTGSYYYTYLFAKRGYRFTEWTMTGDAGSFYRASHRTKNNPTLKFTLTSTDPENPDIVTLQASYEQLETSTILVQKTQNKGSISVSCYNWYERADGLGIEQRTENMESIAMPETEKSYAIYSTDEITLTATPNTAQGFVFQGWYRVDAEGNKTSVSTDPELVLSKIAENRTYYANFALPLTEADKFVVGGYVPCSTLEEAIVTATSMPNKVIRQVNDYTIPAGNYTIPQGVTLLIPCEEAQEDPSVNVERTSEEAIPTGAYRTLTLAAGAHLNVYGTIEVGGKQSTGGADAGGDVGVGIPAGPTYGQMVLNTGSSITLNNGAQFRAWGFVTGNGEIDARRGSKVFEQFQAMDWRGYDYTMAMLNTNHKVLPLTQYFIQNIEAPTKYHPGAKLLGTTAVSVSASFLYVVVKMDDAGIIGVRYNDPNQEDDKAVFLMDNEDDSEDTWVRKYYDPTTDRQVYEVNNAAYLGSLVMKLSALGYDVVMNSAEFVLPITNNFKIHLLNGELAVTQHTVMLPGSEIELDKKSTVFIPDTASLSFYDTDQWDRYVCGHFVNASTYQFTYASRIKYRPGGVPGNEVRDISSAAALGNAKLTVHGTVNVEGQLFTTESGASITSTKEDAGTVLFTNSAPTFSTNHFVEQVSSTTPTYVKAQCVSALLTNQAGSTFGTHSATAGTAAGQSFCFIDIDGDGKCEWVSLTDDEAHCAVYDQGGVYYIKPNTYVPISSGIPTQESDHTYRDHYAGTDSIYIHTLDCQWWCVYPVEGHPDLFECRHKDNHTIYYYDEHEQNWMEKKFKVEWENWDGKPVKYKPLEGDSINYYMVTYGTVPQWLSANPTRPDNANYSYTFAGWNPAFAPVTEDVKYVAQYTETPRKFLITFKNAAGVEMETTSYEYLAMPTPPEADLATYQWSPAISAVTGNQIYQLVAKPEKFTVIYKNWDGEVLQTTSNITSGTATPTAPTATKTADALYSYTFDAWSPAPAATVTADAIYTATFTRGPRSYTIRFLSENGESVLSSTSLAYGATPTPPTGEGTTKASTTSKTYTLVWSPLVGTVVGNQDYTATFTEQTRQYTVTWKNYDGSTITTDYVDYGATPAYSGLTPTKETAEKIFTFTGWSPAISSVAGNQEYTAQFDEGHLKTVTVAVDGTSDISGHVETLVLNASEESSGQLTGNITATNAYFDFAINATTALATGATRQWHSFGVPWQVNLDTDPIQEVGGDNRTFVLGRDYDIIYYDGAKRASSGAGYWCWEYLEYHSHILQPGQGYMIAFIPSLGNIGKIRFVKKNMAPVIFNGTMTVDAHNSGVTTNSGWNAIANPKAYKATLNAGATTGYVYNPATNDYTPYNIENKDYIVGKAVFIQAGASQSVVINNASGNSFVAAAPARRTNATDKKYMSLNDYYQIAIASERVAGGHVYVLPEEEKENKYVIGHDLAQFGMSAAIPQIWVNRYDTKLALNTTALVGETAEFPVGVYAPAAGEYTISLNAQPSEDYTVYLTRDGQVIWNLSDGAFVTTLTSGIQSNYGVRLVRKAPQVATGIDEAVVDAKNETRKVLIDNQVFIIREGHVYTVDGQIVK